MSTITIKLRPIEFDKLCKGEKIHHLARGKQMNEIKIGDQIKFTCERKSRKKTVKGSEMVDIKNRIEQNPLIVFKKKKELKILDSTKSRNFAVNNGNAGVGSILIGMALKVGHISKCKVLHFTDFKYF